MVHHVQKKPIVAKIIVRNAQRRAGLVNNPKG